MQRVGLILFLVLILLGSSLAVPPVKTAQANIGPFFSHGEGIEPLEGGEGVRMKAEQVHIRLFDLAPGVSTSASDESQRYAQVSYRCVFQMENTTQETSDLLVGFPLAPYAPLPQALQEVRVRVDGETVPYETQTQSVTSPGGLPLEGPWAVWPVSFQPEEEREIEVTYSVTAYRGTEKIQIRYTLRTGAVWAGTIGRSLIDFSAPFSIEEGQVSASPTGWALENGVVRWDLRDFEPTDDVYLSLILPELWQPIHEAKAALALADTPANHLALAKAYLALADIPSGDEGYGIRQKTYRQRAEAELESASTGDAAAEATVLRTQTRLNQFFVGGTKENWEEILAIARSNLSSDPAYLGSHLRLALEEALAHGIDPALTLEEALRTQPESYFFSSFYREMTEDLWNPEEPTTPTLLQPLVQMVGPVRIRTVIDANLAGERIWDFTLRLDSTPWGRYVGACRMFFYPIAQLETEKDLYHLRLRLPFAPGGLAQAQSDFRSELLTYCPTAYSTWQLGIPSWALEPFFSSTVQLGWSGGQRHFSESLEAGGLTSFLADQKTALEKARAFWSDTPSRTDSDVYWTLKTSGSPTVCQGVAELIRQDLDLALRDFPSIPWKVQEEVLFTDGEGNPMAQEIRELDLAQPGPQTFSLSAPYVSLDFEDHWAEETIQALIEDGIVSGFPGGNVQPDQPIHRGEIAKLLCLACGLRREPFPAEGSDMPAGHWAAPWLTRLAEEESLRREEPWPAGAGALWIPDQPITRQQAATWLVHLLGGVDAATGAPFSDVGTGDADAHEIDQAHEMGLMEGYLDGTFRPDAFLTRAEAFLIIQRLRS